MESFCEPDGDGLVDDLIGGIGVNRMVFSDD